MRDRNCENPALVAPGLNKKTLVLLGQRTSPDELAQSARGEIPRADYFELVRRLGASILTYSDVERSRHPFVRAAARRGQHWGLAALGVLRRRAFDQFYVSGEDVGVPLAVMLRAMRDLGRITTVAHNIGQPQYRKRLKLLGSSVWQNVIALASRQQEILIREIGYPVHKVHFFELMGPDTEFFRAESEPAVGEYVFSCGRESRDYETLAQAAAESPYPYRVVASGWSAKRDFELAPGVSTTPNMNVESNLSYVELRAAYAKARFVVVPLADVEYAAGLTGIGEAMAMGKAVVVSDSPGIRDYVRDGTSGIVVPIGDPAALRRAVAELWNAPERCAAMGAYNRAWCEASINVDRYVGRVAGLFGMTV